MKLLIMGAGYVGMALIRALQDGAHQLYITTTECERVENLKRYAEQVLVLRPGVKENLFALIGACDAMVVLVAPKGSLNYEQTYLDTAKTISEALKGRVKPFYLVYTSSTSVCEGSQGEWITEDMALDPQTENGKILLEAERYYLNSGAAACVLRLGGIYGPGRELARRAKSLSGNVVSGTGEEPTNNIHQEDVVEAIRYCLNHSLTGVYHLVNDDHTVRNKLYARLCRLAAIPEPLWASDAPQLKRRGYKVSNQKIKDAGFIFEHPFILPF